MWEGSKTRQNPTKIKADGGEGRLENGLLRAPTTLPEDPHGGGSQPSQAPGTHMIQCPHAGTRPTHKNSKNLVNRRHF